MRDDEPFDGRGDDERCRDRLPWVCRERGRCVRHGAAEERPSVGAGDGELVDSGSQGRYDDGVRGSGEGDDEQIFVDMSQVPANVSRIAFTVTIYDSDVRRQNFGQVSNAFIRIVDDTTGNEIIRYDLGEDFSIETAVVVGELYRHNGEWKFNAIGSGFQGGLAALCGHYGIEVA